MHLDFNTYMQSLLFLLADRVWPTHMPHRLDLIKNPYLFCLHPLYVAMSNSLWETISSPSIQQSKCISRSDQFEVHRLFTWNFVWTVLVDCQIPRQSVLLVMFSESDSVIRINYEYRPQSRIHVHVLFRITGRVLHIYTLTFHLYLLINTTCLLPS